MNYNQEQMEENRRALDEAVEHNDLVRAFVRFDLGQRVTMEAVRNPHCLSAG